MCSSDLSGTWLDLSNVDNQSTRGLLSAAEETDRGSGSHRQERRSTVAPTWPVVRHWLTVGAKSSAVSGVTAIVFVFLIRIAFGINRDAGRVLFGAKGLEMLGWALFGFMTAVQIAAAARRNGR